MTSKLVNQQKDVDFVWAKSKLNKEPTTLLVFHQGESGFASFLAGMGLIGEEKPICKIFSKLHSVGAFNSAPEPTFPEWRLFETRNEDGKRFFILRITHAHPLPDSEANDHVWLYTYPIVRDIILELNGLGVDELVYLTTNLLQSAELSQSDEEEYAMIPIHDVAVYDYINHKNNAMTIEGEDIDKPIILAPPAWPFASVFKAMCVNEIKGIWIAIGGRDNAQFIDKETSESLLNYCNSVLGLSYSKSKFEEYEKVLQGFENYTKPFDMDRHLADSGKDMMHG